MGGWVCNGCKVYEIWGGVFVGGGIGMVGQGTRGEVSIDGVRLG